jgi:defect in organelle trafficking protein DotA
MKFSKQTKIFSFIKIKKSFGHFKKIALLAITPILLFMPKLALAAFDVPSITWVPQSTDKSVAFLRQVFGTVGGGLEGGSATIFGQIFNSFNSGILTIAGIILTYTTFRSIFELSNTQEAMQRKFNWWVPMRVVLGVGLLVPRATGYSVLNALVMWTVLQGVGLANTVWGSAVDFLQKGGVVYTQPVSDESKELAKIDTSLLNPDAGAIGTVDILRSTLCMATLQKVITDAQTKLKADYKNHPENYPKPGDKDYNDFLNKMNASYILRAGSLPLSNVTTAANYDDRGRKIGEKETHYIVYFPGPGSSWDDKTATNLKLQGACGGYSWEKVPPCIDTTLGKCDPKDPGEYRDRKETGLKQMVMDLSTIGTMAAEKDRNTLAELNNSAASTIVSTTALYQATIYPSRVFAAQGYTTSTPVPPGDNASQEEKDRYMATYSTVVPRQALNNITDQGWAMAGRFYYRLLLLQTSTAIDSTDYKIIEVKDIDVAKKIPRNPDDDLNDIKKTFQNVFTRFQVTPSIGPYVDDLADKLTNWIGIDKYGNIPRLANKLATEMNATTATAAGAAELPERLKNFFDTASTDLSDAGGEGYRTGFNIKIAGGGGIAGVSDALLYPLSQNINRIVCVWRFELGQTPNCDIPTDWNVNKNTISKVAPVIKVMVLGQSMIHAAISNWNTVINTLGGMMWGMWASSLAMAIASSIAAPFSFFGLGLGAQEAINAIFSFINMTLKVFVEIPLMMALPIVFAFSGMMLTTGITFAYYIPMVPFLLFTFGVISWLAFVVEAMIAAPIVALGITHPEGHDLLGKAEQALMLLFGVFLTPVCLILGLLVSIVLSYVALEVLNAGFGGIIGDIYYSGNSTASTSAFDQIKAGAMILIYFLAVSTMLTTLVFPLISSVRQSVLKWIGFHAEPAPELQALRGIEAGVEKAAGEGAKAVEGAAGRMQPVQQTSTWGKAEKPTHKGKGKSGNDNVGITNQS